MSEYSYLERTGPGGQPSFVFNGIVQFHVTLAALSNHNHANTPARTIPGNHGTDTTHSDVDGVEIT